VDHGVDHGTDTHTPAVQACPSEHAWPQMPQLLTLVRRFVSQPLAGLPSQFPKPEAQKAIWHCPAVHAPMPLGKEHTVPQLPQLVVLVSRSVSQPLAGFPSQFANPELQPATWHCPAVHVEMLLGPPEHTLPQAPQLLTSACRSMSVIVWRSVVLFWLTTTDATSVWRPPG